MKACCKLQPGKLFRTQAETKRFVTAKTAERKTIGKSAPPHRRADLCLRIQSEAMAVGRYLPGDLEPGSDDVVAGRIGNEVSLRRASRLDDDEFELIGVVVGAKRHGMYDHVSSFERE